MRFWLTADPHYGHSRIIAYARRYVFMTPEERKLVEACPSDELRNIPISTESINKHNEGLIARWNSRVTPGDTVYILGDVFYKHMGDKVGEYLKRLNGDIVIVKGNHDKQGGVKTIIDSIQVTFAQRKINMVHKPEDADPNIPINLHGHCHDRFKIRTFKKHYDIIEQIVSEREEKATDRKDLVEFLDKHRNNRKSDSILLNVGVDKWNFYPILFDEAIKCIDKFRRTGEE